MRSRRDKIGGERKERARTGGAKDGLGVALGRRRLEGPGGERGRSLGLRRQLLGLGRSGLVARSPRAIAELDANVVELVHEGVEGVDGRLATVRGHLLGHAGLLRLAWDRWRRRQVGEGLRKGRKVRIYQRRSERGGL